MTIAISSNTYCYADASYSGTAVTLSGVADTGTVFNAYNNVINQNATETDMFTGTMSYRVPIIVPPGRGGMQPDLALSYRSNNGNGWLGMGWTLGVDSIERNTRFGVNYGADDYVMRKSDAVSEIISIGNSDYRAKTEGNFNRIMRTWRRLSTTAIP
ncbi:MAG: SpvB/TcaC N-terminal domain-containing protein [Pedobacter sp.]